MKTTGTTLMIGYIPLEVVQIGKDTVTKKAQLMEISIPSTALILLKDVEETSGIVDITEVGDLDIEEYMRNPIVTRDFNDSASLVGKVTKAEIRNQTLQVDIELAKFN